MLTSILHLKTVNWNTTLWKKQERSFCCYFIYIQNNASNQGTWMPTQMTTPAIMCHVMIYLVISTLLHTSTHTHIYIILQLLITEIFKSCFNMYRKQAARLLLLALFCALLHLSLLETKRGLKHLCYIVKKLINKSLK